MSRIGNKPVERHGTNIVIGKEVLVSGALGSLRFKLPPVVGVENRGLVLLVRPRTAEKHCLMMQGTIRALLNNAIKGVRQGFRRSVTLVGVGYKAQLQGEKLVLHLGLSHAVHYTVPPKVQLTIKESGEIEVFGVDKQLVGQTAADIRKLRPLEPYKGKGIRYSDENCSLKERKKNK